MKKIKILLLTLFICSSSLYAQKWQWIKKSNPTNWASCADIAIDTKGNTFVSGIYNDGTLYEGVSCSYNISAFGFISKYDSLGNFKWARNISTHGATVEILGIETDLTGNCYVMGSFQEEVIFTSSVSLKNNWEDEIFLAKYNNNGDFQWAKVINYDPEDFKICKQTDEIFIIEEDYNRIYMSKINYDGNTLWTDSIRGASYFHEFDIDKAGNIYVAGILYNSNLILEDDTIISAYDGIFYAKYSNSGDLVWVNQIDDVQYGSLSFDGFVVDEDGNSFISCSYDNPVTVQSTTIPYESSNFILKTTSVGEVDWYEHYNGDLTFELAADSKGSVYISGDYNSYLGWNIGDTTLPAQNNAQYFAKFDTEGNFVWAKLLSELESASCNITRHLEVDEYGNCYTAGTLDNDINFADGFSFSDINVDHIIVGRITENAGLTSDLNTESNISISISPNPACDFVDISINETSETNMNITVYDILGNIIESEKVDQNEVRLNVSNWGKGTYPILITTNSLIQSDYIIIK